MGRPPITALQRKERARQRTRDWKLTHPYEVKMQKKRYKQKAREKRDKPLAPPRKDPTGELEYSGLDGIDMPYAEPGANNSAKPHSSDDCPSPGAGAHEPPGIDDPLGSLEPESEPASLAVADSAGIEEPPEFLADLENEHKRAMLAHLRKELEQSYDRDKERLRQQFGQGKV